MAVLKIKDAAGNWVDITGTGTQGPSGGPVPVGGNPGEVIVKTGPADMEVGWEVHPRVALTVEVASTNSGATANAFVELVFGDMTINPDRQYHIFAGIRCIQDPGAVVAIAQFQVGVGTINLTGYDVVSTPDTGLWGSWCQQWLKDSATLGVASGSAPTSARVVLRGMISVAAAKTFYSPRLTIIEY